MTVVSMEFAVLGDILLGVWIVTLPWPLDCIVHSFHDGYTFDGLDIEDSTLINPHHDTLVISLLIANY